MAEHAGGAETGADPCYWPARTVAAAIASRELSAREYLTVLRDRIDRYNDALHLVTAVDERAEAWAREADETLVRHGPRGPLHGVAMTVKDSLATAGLRTTAGTADLAHYRPAADAEAVAALRRAGAIVFGKTNLPANSMDVQTFNDMFGAARNPWNPSRTTGGSSGGGAGAVAAGFSPLELGSDIAGSIRIPAGNCGVFGHKPSFGVVPISGHLPPYQPTVPDLAVVGPLARDVADLSLLLDVVAAPHPWDRPAWRLHLPPARPVRRVAVWLDDPYCPVDPAVSGTLEAAAALLENAGLEVVATSPPGVRLDASTTVLQRCLASAAVAAQRAGDGPGPDRSGLGGEFLDQYHHDWVRAQHLRDRLRKCWQRFFTTYDAILLPVAPNLAITHDHRPFAQRRITVDGRDRPYWDQVVWAGVTGVSQLPTTVVPIRRDPAGVPIGVAVAGAYLEDRTTLAVADLLAGLAGPIGAPDLDAAVSSLTVRRSGS